MNPMKTILPCSVGCLVAMLTVSLAAPLRPLREPPEATESPKIADLTGTAWSTVFHKQKIIYLFEDNGVLSYLYNGNRWANKGNWKHERDHTSFKWLWGFEFQGTAENADSIVGEIVEKNGDRTPLK